MKKIGFALLFILFFGLMGGGMVFSHLILYPRTATLEEGTKMFGVKNPGDKGIPFEEKFLRTSDGLKIRTWFMENPLYNGKGIIWVQHGHGVTMQKIIRVMPFLFKAGYHLFSLEWRSHGGSDRGMTTFGAHEILDALAGKKYLEEKKPGIPVSVLGFSMGSAILLKLEAENPGFQSFVSDATYLDIEKQIYSEGLRLYGVGKYPLGILATQLAAFRGGFSFEDLAPERHFSKIKIPILIIHGKGDIKIPWEAGQTLAKIKMGPRESWFPEKAGHVKSFDEFPQEYQEKVLDFFNRTQ